MLVSKLEQIKDKDGNLRGLLIAPEWISKIDYSDNPKYLFAKELLPCIKTIGGLSSNLDLSSIYNKNGFLGYVDGVEDSISRNKMLMDTPLKNCLLEWVKSKYRKSHSKMLKSDHLSTEYLRLITFFGFENEIIQDNLKMYYTNYTSNRYNKVEGTIFDLIDIHKYLTIGILSTSGVTRGVLCHKVERNTYYIDNKNNSEIINKYSNWFLFHPFDDVNKRTLGLLVNLMIDRKQDKMINWESVDYKKLISLLNQKGGSDKVGKYLKSFLSQDYLNKMIEL